MLIKYISEILKKKELVIIPDFGAIFKNQMSAVVDNDKNVLKPPYITYTFNEFLKYNDGEIAGLVKEAESITQIEAEEKIKLEVQEIKQKLEQGSKIQIDGVGDLTLGANGKTILISLDIKDKDENFGLPEIKVEAVTKEEPVVVEEKAEEVIVPIIEEITTEPAEIEIVDADKVIEEKKKEIIIEEVPIATTHWSENEEPQVNTVPINNIEEPAEKEEFIQSDVLEPVIEPKRKKRTGLVIFLSILVLLICIISVALIVAPEKVKEMTKNLPFIGHTNDTVITRDTVIKKDTVIENTTVEEQAADSVIVDEPTPEKVKAEPVKPKEPPKSKESATNGNFYIVAGSFSVAANAEKLSTQLQVKGFSAQVINYKGKSTVVYGTYTTQTEVNEALAKIRSGENKDAWILKK
ncbi:MAG: SPOR domain-containing protein [Bacteroidota bacterium]